MSQGQSCLCRWSHCPPPCSCHPHTLLGVPAGEQRDTTADKKASHSLPSCFLRARPQIGSRNLKSALPVTHSPRSDPFWASVSSCLIMSIWARRTLRYPRLRRLSLGVWHRNPYLGIRIWLCLTMRYLVSLYCFHCSVGCGPQLCIRGSGTGRAS